MGRHDIKTDLRPAEFRAFTKALVARWFALQVFHLLGYRKYRTKGDVLGVSRRREQLMPEGEPGKAQGS